MRTYVYLILAALVASIILQPLTEIAFVCKDRIEVGCAISNSVRAAKKECYTYFGMRDLHAQADKEVFLDTFAKTFASSMGMNYSGGNAYRMVFEPKYGDERYNRFIVTCNFVTSRQGNREVTRLVVNSESEYRFKMNYLKEASNVIRGNGGTYKLCHTRDYNMLVTN